MSKWSIGDIIGTVATGGAYGIYKGVKDEYQGQADQAQSDYEKNLYEQNKQNYANAMNLGKDLESKIMGDTAQDLGKRAKEYQDMLYSNINKDTVQSDIARQKQDYQLSRAQAKAGLAGVDTTAGRMQEERNAAMQARAVNEKFKQDALGRYGQSIGATQNAVANLWLGTMGIGMAAQQTPIPMQQPGVLGGIAKDIGL